MPISTSGCVHSMKPNAHGIYNKLNKSQEDDSANKTISLLSDGETIAYCTPTTPVENHTYNTDFVPFYLQNVVSPTQSSHMSVIFFFVDQITFVLEKPPQIYKL